MNNGGTPVNPGKVRLGDKSDVTYVNCSRCPYTTYAVALCGMKAANWRSRALLTPERQASAMDWDAGSGKISSSPFSSPSKMPVAANSVETFGMLKPRFMSVSTGPKTTACTVTPWLASSTLNDCVRFSAAAFEVE